MSKTKNDVEAAADLPRPTSPRGFSTSLLLQKGPLLLLSILLLPPRLWPGVGVDVVVVMGQQTPAYSTAKYDPTASHRTNVCERQRRLYNDTISLPDALSGLELSAVLTDYPNPFEDEYFSLDADGAIDRTNPGLFAIVLDELARRAKFTWRDSFGVVSPPDPDTDGNKTWADLMVWQTHVYDIGVEKYSKSADRMAREVSFPEGYVDASIVLVGAKPVSESKMRLFSFFAPFDYAVWIMIVVTIFFTGFVYWLLEKLNSQSDRRQLESDPAQSVFLASLVFTQHYEFRPQTNSARLVAFSLTFWALIIGSAYTANLASFLVVEQTPARQIESVPEAVRVGAPVCLIGGTLVDDLAIETFPNDAIFVRKKSESEVFLGVLSGECVLAVVPMSTWEIHERISTVNVNCALRQVGGAVMIIPAGFVTAVDTGIMCTSLVSHVLDYHMVQMKADGFVDRAWRDHLQRVGDQNCINLEAASGAAEGGGGGGSGGGEDYFQFSMRDLGGIFIVHGAMAAVAFLLALLRRSLVERRRNSPKFSFSQRGGDGRGGEGEADECDNIGGRSSGSSSSSRSRSQSSGSSATGGKTLKQRFNVASSAFEAVPAHSRPPQSPTW